MNNTTPTFQSVIDRLDPTARHLIENSLISRSTLLTELFDSRRDIDIECGYPKDITAAMFRYLYDREGIGHRVVSVMPEECWSHDPEVRENEDPEETPFEEAWNVLQSKKNLWHYLHRVDELSGIGRFGVLLLGLSDGLDLSEPVAGINERGEKVEGPEGLQVLYVRAFDESVATVDRREVDERNPRFGQPTQYTLTFRDMEEGGGSATHITRRVHWSRVIHVADNRQTSEIYGTPRMQVVYNRIYDIRKILSGSGEMFWKGAFPGYSFEVNPDIVDPTLDTDTLRDELANWANGLQRYFAVQGVSAKSLAPQVADPSNHIEAQLENIAITLGIPKRILFGSEQAKLASSQDVRTWNRRLWRRQTKYLTPMLISPLVERLIYIGVLPEPADGPDAYEVVWPDLNTLSDEEWAIVAERTAKTLATYIQAGVDQVVPPAEFLSMIMGRDVEEVKQIMKAAKAYAFGEDDAEDEEE